MNQENFNHVGNAVVGLQAEVASLKELVQAVNEMKIEIKGAKEVHSTITSTMGVVEAVVKELKSGSKMTVDAMLKKVGEVEEAVRKMGDRLDEGEEKIREVEKRTAEGKGGGKGFQGPRLNDMKGLQQSARVYDGSLDAKAPGFSAWREDVETMVAHDYPGLELVMAKLRFGVEGEECEPLTRERVEEEAEEQGVGKNGDGVLTLLNGVPW